MNTPHEHEARDREAREWETQEHARRQARAAAAVSPDPDDGGGSGFSRELSRTPESSPTTPHAAAEAPYQRIAEALRGPPPVDLPADFAVHVARLAEERAPVLVPERSRLKPLPQSGAFERALAGVLVFVFALCALLSGAIYGARVLAQMQAAVGVQGLQWAALLVGCLGLSWAVDWLRRRFGHGDAMRMA